VFLFEESKKNGRIYVKFNSVFIDAVKEQAQILKTFITQHPLGMIIFFISFIFLLLKFMRKLLNTLRLNGKGMQLLE
jgi:hypothetical protein